MFSARSVQSGVWPRPSSPLLCGRSLWTTGSNRHWWSQAPLLRSQLSTWWDKYRFCTVTTAKICQCLVFVSNLIYLSVKILLLVYFFGFRILTSVQEVIGPGHPVLTLQTSSATGLIVKFTDRRSKMRNGGGSNYWLVYHLSLTEKGQIKPGHISLGHPHPVHKSVFSKEHLAGGLHWL